MGITITMFLFSSDQIINLLPGKPSSRGGFKFVFSLINGFKKDVIKRWLICFFKHSQWGVDMLTISGNI